MSSENKQPPRPPALEAVKKLIAEAINENREAAAQIPSASELRELSKDVGHMGLSIKVIGSLLLILAGACCAMYMRLDDKIGEETKYLNSRIDALMQESIKETTH